METTHPKCKETKKCQETESFKGTEHEGVDVCEDGCVWAGREVKQLSSKQEEIIDLLKELETLLQERITELYQVKGMQVERHAFTHYREYVWKIQKRMK
jgi:hypothetical protein